MANPLLVIPARVNSTRLPGKVLADIGGKPMISRVYERCLASGAGPVLVACDGPEVAWEIEKIGGQVCLTDPALPSGSDRVHAAVTRYDPEGKHDIIVCVQGDLPTLEPELISRALYPLEQNPETDIATLANLIIDEEEIINPNIVKIALAVSDNPFICRALYFSRCPIPAGPGPKYHHIGLYAYRRPALEHFVSLPPSPLESQEKLEQLRALEAGLQIDVTLVSTVPLGVDTPEDLIAARAYYQALV